MIRIRLFAIKMANMVEESKDEAIAEIHGGAVGRNKQFYR